MSIKREVLADLRSGAIVRVGGRWGVVCRTNKNDHNKLRRTVDFWDGGREHVLNYRVVEVLR